MAECKQVAAREHTAREVAHETSGHGDNGSWPPCRINVARTFTRDGASTGSGARLRWRPWLVGSPRGVAASQASRTCRGRRRSGCSSPRTSRGSATARQRHEHRGRRARPTAIDRFHPPRTPSCGRRRLVGVRPPRRLLVGCSRSTGVRIPDDQYEGDRAVGQVFWRPGEGKEFRELPEGRHRGDRRVLGRDQDAKKKPTPPTRCSRTPGASPSADCAATLGVATLCPAPDATASGDSDDLRVDVGRYLRRAAGSAEMQHVPGRVDQAVAARHR